MPTPISSKVSLRTFWRCPSLAIQFLTTDTGVASALLPQARFSPVAQSCAPLDVRGQTLGDRLPAGRDVAEEAALDHRLGVAARGVLELRLCRQRQQPARDALLVDQAQRRGLRGGNGCEGRQEVRAGARRGVGGGRRKSECSDDCGPEDVEGQPAPRYASARGETCTWASGSALGSSHAPRIGPRGCPGQLWTVGWTPVRPRVSSRSGRFWTPFCGVFRGTRARPAR